MAVSVLIVEDDRNIAELLQMYLEKEGYAVTVAADGGQGLAKFRAIKPDLVLLDVMMPVMDGWSVCKAIRAEAQRRGLSTDIEVDGGIDAATAPLCAAAGANVLVAGSAVFGAKDPAAAMSAIRAACV